MLALLVLSATFAGVPALGFAETGNVDSLDLPWPGPTVGRGSVSEAPLLWMRAGIFDPLTDPIPSAMGLNSASSRGVYMVQFSADLGPEVGDRLDSVGAFVLGYVPEDGLVVSFSRPSIVASVALWDDVRWLAPWQDGWKVMPFMDQLEGRMLLNVLTWSSSHDISSDLTRAGATVKSHLLDEYVVDVDVRSIPVLARMGSISWIEPWSPPTFMMDNAARTVGARQDAEGNLDPDGTEAWAFNLSMDRFQGITGQGVIVDVTDTGMDGTHQAFSGRTKAYSAIEPGRVQWTDPVGHGTHVAGIVLGDGTYRAEEAQFYHDNYDGKYAGVAPGADLVAQSLYGPGINFTYRNITKWSVMQGADISQNSWGNHWDGFWGNYTIVSRDYDNTTRDADWTTPGNQSLLVIFSAGNNGLSGNHTISTNAVAKNIISVGATGNGKNVTGSDEVWLYSSKGMTDDGRIKPDLVAPGDEVVSTWATEDNGASGDLPADSGAHSYITYGGTSMAAPIVSGSAALVYDHLRNDKDHADPSPAVVKSILLASADHLPGYDWPSREQGWGLVNASRAVVETRNWNTEFVDQSTKFYNIGESMTYRYEVQAGTPLSISLVWTDLPSHTYAGKMLVNDLDLEVESPSGKVYKGNWFQSGYSVIGGTADNSNNVEMVYLGAPESGEWLVTVSCAELPPVYNGGNQDFAISVVGNVNKKFVDLAAQNLSVRAQDAAEGDIIPIAFDIANLGNLPAISVLWECRVLDEEGMLYKKLDSGIVNLAPRSGNRFNMNWTAVRGTFTIMVTPNPSLSMPEETYQNNNDSKRIFIKGFGVSGFVPNAYREGPPGKDVTFTIEVTNEGNVDDLFLLSRSEPPSGWNARLDQSFLDIKPGKNKTATLVVTLPTGTMAGELANISVIVVSQGNDTNQVELETQTEVAGVLGLTVVLDKISQDARPGDTVTFQFEITNIGNTLDTYRVSYRQTSGPTSGVSFDLPRATFTAQVAETVTGELMVILDADAVSDLAVNDQIAFDLSVVSAINITVGHKVPGSVIIKQLHSVSITPPTQETFNVLPGDTLDMVVEYVNEGNGPDTITPTMTVPEGWEWESTEPTIYLQPGEAKTVQIWVTVVATAQAGPHPLVAHALIGEDVHSNIDINFIVDWTPSISIRLDGPQELNITQGEELTLEFRVTNTGNDRDTVTVEFAGLTRGLRVEARPPSVQLDVAGIATVIVVFNATEDAELLRGTYRITFKHADETDLTQVQVNITIQKKAGTTDPDDPTDPDDEGGISMMVIGIIVLVVIIILVAVFFMRSGSSRRSDSKMEEDFFKAKDDKATSAILQEELASRRAPIPPPATIEPPETAPVSDWEESTTEPAVAAPSRSGACPDCGNAMESLGAGSDGMYCPMCGHKEEGG
jgi:subtilisin family serine protease/uncharacterized membrane protein